MARGSVGLCFNRGIREVKDDAYGKRQTANGKREITPRDHVYIILAARCFQFLCLIE